MLVRASDLLRETHSEFIVSRYRLKQAEGISLVRANRQSGNQSLAFSSRPFILCGLPIRRPPKDQLLLELHNGSFRLQVTGHPDFGLPFGQDRLVLILLATLAVRQKSNVIRFRSAAEMLEVFGMAKGGSDDRFDVCCRAARPLCIPKSCRDLVRPRYRDTRGRERHYPE